MKRNNPLLTRMKNIHLPDKNALWTVAFTALAVMSLILFFAVKPLILKLLFLLTAIGAAFYIWLLIESRRITPKPAKNVSTPGPLPETLATETEDEAPERTEAGENDGESPQPLEQDEHLVFVSEKGDKYHLDRKCAGLRFADNVETMPVEKAISLNRKPCSKCRPKAKEE